MTRRMTEAELADWRTVATAVLSDERQHRGVLFGPRPLFPERRFAAQAFTIHVEDVDNGAPRRAIAEAWPGAAMVIDARIRSDGAVWGGNLAALATKRGLSAIIVDGLVRDVSDLRASGLAVYSRGMTPRGPVWGGSLGVPVECGGVLIQPGDLLVGDEDGIVAVPLEAADAALLAQCRARLARESEEVKR